MLTKKDIFAKKGTLASKEEKGAISIAFALAVIILLFVLAVTSLTNISTDTKGSSNFLIKERAFFAAESGLEWALGELKQDPFWRAGASNVPVIGGGAQFTVSLVDRSTIPALNDSVIINSTGTDGDIQKSIQAYALASGGDVWPYAVFADNNAKLLGSGTVNGDVHANNTVDLGSVTVNGAVTSGGSVALPTVDWNFYEGEAIAAGQKVTGDKTFKNNTYTGVWYITGTATIRQNATINGTIVAANDVVIMTSGNLTIQATPSNYPALVCGNTISYNNSIPEIKGIVYAAADIVLNANFQGRGALIAAVTVDCGSSYATTITYDTNYTTNVAGMSFGGGGDTIVTVTSWREL
jgi:hypothetical protein